MSNSIFLGTPWPHPRAPLAARQDPRRHAARRDRRRDATGDGIRLRLDDKNDDPLCAHGGSAAGRRASTRIHRAEEEGAAGGRSLFDDGLRMRTVFLGGCALPACVTLGPRIAEA